MKWLIDGECSFLTIGETRTVGRLPFNRNRVNEVCSDCLLEFTSSF